MNIFINKNLLTLLGISILIVSIPVTLYLVQHPQIFKGTAQEIQTENLPASLQGKIGFNYYPYGDCIQTSCFHSIIAWISTGWPHYRPQYEKDLKIMKSFGASVLRLSLYNPHEGFKLNGGCTEGGCPGGTVNTPEYQQTLHNLPEILQLAQDNGFKVIVNFVPSYFNWQTKNVKTWWQWAYGNTEGGFQRFINDQKTWTQGIIDATHNAPNILYYDLLNEAFSDLLPAYYPRFRYWDYARFAWDNLQNIPPGKLGIGILCANLDPGPCQYRANDIIALEATLSATIRGKQALNFIDFHSYPRALSYPGWGVNLDMAKAYATASAHFPNAKVVIGEWGMRFFWIDVPPNASEAQKEDIQAATESAMLNRAAPLPIINLIHWQLWDACNRDCDWQHRGWGYSPQEPRDVYGQMAERFSKIPNSDFEQGATSPSGWSVGGTGASLVWGTGEPDSATNNHYGRVRTNVINALIWLTHNVINISQTATGLELYLNAYLRSNLESVLINIVELDANRNRTRVTSMPTFTPTPGQWQNLQYEVGPWKMTLLPNTRFLNVAFGGRSGMAVPESGVYLDVDAVTLNLNELAVAPTPTPTPTSPPPPTGGYGDNIIDIKDYNAFLSCFRKKVSEVSGCEAADLNDDGLVDSSDFVLLFNSFQTQYGD